MPTLVLLSDTHSKHRAMPLPLPEGDILIHAGDATMHGTPGELQAFFDWFAHVGDYQHRVFVAGNHDLLFERQKLLARSMVPANVNYLENSGVQMMGLSIWGSPITPYFRNWAFNRTTEQISRYWEMIPNHLDVLITHGPPQGILDGVLPHWTNVGCPRLAHELKARVSVRLHVFGHVHESAGQHDAGRCSSVNASVCDHRYEPVHPARVIRL